MEVFVVMVVHHRGVLFVLHEPLHGGPLDEVSIGAWNPPVDLRIHRPLCALRRSKVVFLAGEGVEQGVQPRRDVPPPLELGEVERTV